MLHRQVVDEPLIVEAVRLRVLRHAEAFAEDLLEQVATDTQHQARRLRGVAALEDVEDRHEKVRPFELVEVALVLRPVEGLIELEDLGVQQLRAEAGELGDDRYEVVLQHERREGVAVLSHYFVEDLHDQHR